MIYRLFVPKQPVGANLVYFDLFNATGSGRLLEVLSVLPLVSSAVAVVGTLGVDLLLTRTTAVGTGGTAATSDGTSTTAATISGHSGQQVINTLITARLGPTGGATAGAVLSWRSLFTEELTATAPTSAHDLVRYGAPDVGGIMVPQNGGLRVVQGADASVGNIGFDVTFRLIWTT